MTQVKSEKILRYYNDFYRNRRLQKKDPLVADQDYVWDYECSYLHLPLLAYLKNLKTEKTLEIGLGEGLFASRVSGQRENEETSYIGIDFSREGVKIANEKIKKKDFYFLTADGLHLPFKSCQFDVVVCSEVVEHVTEKRRLLMEINRVLKLPGYLILTTPNLSSLVNVDIFARFVNLLKRSNSVGQIVEEQVGPSELVRLLGETRFSIIDFKSLVFYSSSISWLEKLIKKPLLFARTFRALSQCLEESSFFRYLGLYQVVLARK